MPEIMLNSAQHRNCGFGDSSEKSALASSVGPGVEHRSRCGQDHGRIASSPKADGGDQFHLPSLPAAVPTDMPGTRRAPSQKIRKFFLSTLSFRTKIGLLFRTICEVPAQRRYPSEDLRV